MKTRLTQKIEDSDVCVVFASKELLDLIRNSDPEVVAGIEHAREWRLPTFIIFFSNFDTAEQSEFLNYFREHALVGCYYNMPIEKSAERTSRLKAVTDEIAANIRRYYNNPAYAC